MANKQLAVKAVGLLGNEESRVSTLDHIHNAYEAKKSGTLDSNLSDKFKKAANVFSNFIAAPLLLAKELSENKGDSLRGALQAFTPSTAIPEHVTSSFDVFRQYANIDDRAMQSFKTRSFDPLRDFLEIYDVDGGIFLEEIAEGEKVKYSTVSGTKARIDAVDYGAGIEIPWRMIETRQWSSLVDLGQEFAWGVMNLKQKVLYGLLVDGAVTNGGAIAWPGGASDLDDLISVINSACDAISDDLKDQMEIDASMAPMNLYVHGGDINVARFRNALNHSTNYNSTVTSAITSRQINLIPTYNLVDGTGTALAANQAIMVLPGRKIQYGERVAPTTYTDDDIDSFSTKNTLRFSFAATVADVRQCKLINVS